MPIAVLPTELHPFATTLVAIDPPAWTKAVLRRTRVPGQLCSADADDLAGWDKLTLTPITLSAGPTVKMVLELDARQRTQTVAAADWPGVVARLLTGLVDHLHVLSPAGDWHARKTKRGRWLISHGRPSERSPATGQPPGDATSSVPPARAGHDRVPQHILPPDDRQVRTLFTRLGLFAASGQVRGAQAHKYRQVQHYLELLRPLPIWQRPRDRPLRIIDAGAGRAYMSLALYLYATRLGHAVELLAVDTNPAVLADVDLIAGDLGYAGVSTRTMAVAELEAGPADLLVSLHACDTATDDAIAAGVRLGAQVIVLAPCCQHELAAQIRTSDWSGGSSATPGHPADLWSPVLRHGLLTGRLADILTDALRADALEAAGYRAEVIEFISAEHTAKNLMIRAVRRTPPDARSAAAATLRFRRLADHFNVAPKIGSILSAPTASAEPRDE